MNRTIRAHATVWVGQVKKKVCIFAEVKMVKVSPKIRQLAKKKNLNQTGKLKLPSSLGALKRRCEM